MREKKRQSRGRQTSRTDDPSTTVNHCQPISETETETEKKNTPLTPQGGDDPCGSKVPGPIKPQGSDRSTAAQFDCFWAEYPRKVAKKKCRAIWQGLKLAPDQVEKLLEAVRCYKRTDQWQKDGGQFIPHPGTFLNQGRWEDEIPAVPDPKPGDDDWYPTDEQAAAPLREPVGEGND